jgi:hypothetical protein
VTSRRGGVSPLFISKRLLYSLVRSKQAYEGPNPPLRAIRSGDNWFYHGSEGYNLGAGVGVMDVANFASTLRESD